MLLRVLRRWTNPVAVPILINDAKRKKLIRCFLWLVLELDHVWDSQLELTGSVVGSGSEVDEVFKSSSHSFC